MFIVITGLDGSGTTTIAEKLHELDKNSILLRTPSLEYSNRDLIDTSVRDTSQLAHYYYYLSSVIYISDYIRKNVDYENNNVYCVRYLIDTVVSHQVAGLNVEMDYEKFNILKPDKTIFVELEESIRQDRISARGKGVLDTVLDDEKIRTKFLEKFNRLLPKDTIFFDNKDSDVTTNINKLYETIQQEE